MPSVKKIDDTIADAMKKNPQTPHTTAGRRVKASTILKKQKKKLGRPEKYTEAIGRELCKRISEGETITAVSKSMGFTVESVYRWVEKYEDFRERYYRSRKDQATSLISQLVDEFQENLTNENALAARTKANLFQWIAARQNPHEYGDVKRLELAGQVNHVHTHRLEDHQKRRIAESWLISQSAESVPLLIEATPEPALDRVAATDTERTPPPPRRKKVATVQTKTGSPDEGGRWRDQ